MGTISRPNKAGGTNTYVTEVAAGFTDIIDSEVDGDFKTIYDEFNGNITDANIQAHAAIQYSKLLLTGQITNTDILNGSINGHQKLAPASVTGAEIAPLTILLGNLAIGAGVGGQNQAAGAPAAGSGVGEIILAEIAMTGRGGIGVAWGAFSGGMATFGAPTVLTMRLRLNSTPGVPNGTIIDTQSFSLTSAGSPLIGGSCVATFFACTRLQLTAQGDASGSWAMNHSKVVGVEWA